MEDRREDEVVSRIFGTKYDSLSELLRKMLEIEDRDPVHVYVTFLTARQLRDKLVEDYVSFFESHKQMRSELDELLERGLRSRRRIQFGDDVCDQKFLTWFEKFFLREYRI